MSSDCPDIVEQQIIDDLRDNESRQVETTVRQLPKNEWENCPNSHCNNTGVYPVEPDGDAEQCEFCWSNWKSTFFQRNKLYLKA